MMTTRIGLLCVLTFLAAACSNDPATPEAETSTPVAQRAAPTVPPAAENPPTPVPATPVAATPVATPPPPMREVTAEELQPLRDAVARDLDDVAAQRDLASLLWEGGQYDLALNHFERAVQIDPNNPGSLRDLGRAYEMLGRPSDAEGAYRRMATIPAAYHLALHELGNLAMTRGDLKTAMRYYAQSIEKKPDYVGALYGLGVAYEQSGRFREAYESYARVLQLDPPDDSTGALEYLDALFRMGKLDLKMGAIERAAEILAEVVETYPNHPEAHNAYGRALQMLGREDEAQREFAIHGQLLGEGSTP